MELRKAGSWNVLQLAGFFIPLSPQLHITFTRGKDLPGSLLDCIRADTNDPFRGEKEKAHLYALELLLLALKCDPAGGEQPGQERQLLTLFHLWLGKDVTSPCLMHHSKIWNTSSSITLFDFKFVFRMEDSPKYLFFHSFQKIIILNHIYMKNSLRFSPDSSFYNCALDCKPLVWHRSGSNFSQVS